MQKSVNQYSFSQVPTVDMQRSTFNRSFNYKTTFDAGYLVPFYVDEVIPGDTFDVSASLLCRLNTPIYPIMDNLYLETFYFYVPNRLLWDHWKNFMGEQRNPEDSTDYLLPTVSAPVGGWQSGSLSDYFGLPTLVDNLTVTSLWHRAYNLIYLEWFKDENLQDSPVINYGDGPDNDSDYVLRRRGKRHDYFTSALPWPMKPINGDGSTSINLPLGVSAPVIGNGITLGLTNGTLDFGIRGSGNNYAIVSDTTLFGATAGAQSGSGAQHDTSHGLAVTSDSSKSGLIADLTGATAATINSLRVAFQTQKFYEAMARAGSRYVEILRNIFNVIPSDASLQRPEYLGGSISPINITPVAQNGSSDTTSPQGNLAAFGIGTDLHHGFTKSFTEHGVIIGLVNVRADLTYQQGIPRMFSRSTKLDFYWPQFAHLGEQAILNKEIYAQGTLDDDGVFGYQERYAEYRYYPSKITGEFRSNYPQSLDSWHLSQKFESLPTLSDAFIQDTPPIDRIVAVPSEPDFKLDCYVTNKTTRPMPMYSVPGLVDHF